mgnify:FL=1
MMRGLIVSTIAYFVASFAIRRWLDTMDVPKGLTRSTVIFSGALIAAYGVAAAVDRLAG